MTYHILNGDALLHQLPDSIKGERIVMRECLVDGNVAGETLEELLQNREVFIQKAFEETDYRSKMQAELDKINAIPEGTEIALWFEQDLFCQVNLWFTCWYINTYKKASSVFLVISPENAKYGFGYLRPEDLPEVFEARTPLSEDEVSIFAKLWKAYQKDDFKKLQVLGQEHQTRFPFLAPTIEAHIARQPRENFLGQPKETLKALVAAYGDDNFGQIFQEFSKHEAIYGYGDLQVKRILEEI